jgi:hypothetical protein
MRQIKEDNRLLASLAVFRELYNAEKDVYGIISVFLSDLIKIENLYSFSLNEITNKLNSTFEAGHQLSGAVHPSGGHQ